MSRATNSAGFTCSSNEINRWFRTKALKEHLSGSVKVTCAVETGVPNRPYGFYALAMVAEEVRNLPGRYHGFRASGHFSALQLVWLATDKGFTDEGLGTVMVGRVIRTFAQVGPQIGLPQLIVSPDPSNHARLSAFYNRLGFTPYNDGESMFLDIRSAVEALRIGEAAAAAAAIPLAATDSAGAPAETQGGETSDVPL